MDVILDDPSPPPPYSPERPPPPYVRTVEIGADDVNDSKAKADKEMKLPFSTVSASKIVYPEAVLLPPTTSQSINPSVSGPSTVSFVVTNYVVKKATTTEPHNEYCPKCQCQIRTRQSYKSGRLTWLLVIIILILFFPIAFVPFLIDSCKDVRHYCPKCKMLLSVKKRFFF